MNVHSPLGSELNKWWMADMILHISPVHKDPIFLWIVSETWWLNRLCVPVMSSRVVELHGVYLTNHESVSTVASAHIVKEKKTPWTTCTNSLLMWYVMASSISALNFLWWLNLFYWHNPLKMFDSLLLVEPGENEAQFPEYLRNKTYQVTQFYLSATLALPYLYWCSSCLIV